MMRTRHLRNLTVAAALAWGLFWPFHFTENSPFWERLMDGAHLPLFFLVTWWWNSMLPPDVRTGLRLTKVVSITIGMAALVEWIQPLTGRSESLVDFRNGVIGALAGILAIYLRQAENRWPMKALLGAVVIGGSALALGPAWMEWRGLEWRARAFPLLGDFENPAELRLWTAQGGSSNGVTVVRFSRQHATRGEQTLEVVTARSSWAGISYAAGDRDWSGRVRLVADFYNPGEAFTLGVRVDDDGDCRSIGQRFDREWRMERGASRLEILTADIGSGAKGRQMNLRVVRRLVFFTGEEQPGRTFFLDNVRLE